MVVVIGIVDLIYWRLVFVDVEGFGWEVVLFVVIGVVLIVYEVFYCVWCVFEWVVFCI